MITEKKMGLVARLCASVWRWQYRLRAAVRRAGWRWQYRLRAAVRRAGWRWGQQPAGIPALCVKPETKKYQ